MRFLLLVAVLLATPTSDETYEAVRQKAIETEKPIVVMVSTEWCPPCKVMKKTILPKVAEHGYFEKVMFATVNPDKQKELAQLITGGGAIPQLIMFRKSSKGGWLRKKIIGQQTVETVEEFINQGLWEDAKEKNDS
jgi:thioredoxin-like negative regulator of GroEL